jgi:hypothetical protein
MKIYLQIMQKKWKKLQKKILKIKFNKNLSSRFIKWLKYHKILKLFRIKYKNKTIFKLKNLKFYNFKS